MAHLTKEQLFQTKLKAKSLPVPELGGHLTVRVIPGKLLGRFYAAAKKWQEANGMDHEALAELAIIGCVNEAGAPMFDETDKDKFAEVGWPVLQRIALEVIQHNRMSEAEAEATEKN